jgi:hypothetical protein
MAPEDEEFDDMIPSYPPAANSADHWVGIDNPMATTAAITSLLGPK